MIFVSGRQLLEIVANATQIFPQEGTAIGVGWLDDDHKLIAAAAVHDIDGYRRGANLSLVVMQPAKITRAVPKKLADIVFNDFRLNRVTMIARRDNARSIRAIKFAGAKPEGVLRRADHDGCDMLVFGLLKEECKWIPRT